MKYKHEELILNIIKTIIASSISGYALAYIENILIKFIFTAIIILTTFFTVEFINKLIKRYVIH